ncbi:hypothetical protein PPROV_000296000 [Pycnococcus provasolii]|uniref:Sof1-like protein domain-containing protein n=4 Tax=Pycnococcus provasolii TaxID=41880 RepID=A0A830HA60_9CHLO|nr:hypothetical protein PPROV_000296000 [Pycnococcus provasolii]
MVKVKLMQRDAHTQGSRERTGDAHAIPRNLDPAQHPMERARELARAVTAAKLDRMFAKPLRCALEGHGDAVYALSSTCARLDAFVSGAADGELRLWHVPTARATRSFRGHTAAVRGCCIAPTGATAISVSDDTTVRMWRLPQMAVTDNAMGHVTNRTATTTSADDALFSFHSKGGGALRGVDHAYETSSLSSTYFAVAGSCVEVYDGAKLTKEPVSTFSWGCDTLVYVRFNAAESNLFATAGTDRCVVLYDLRSSTPVRKLKQQTRSNCVSWNPMEPYNFVCGNEDHNAYSYDMRNLERALCVHKDHVSAIMDIDFSPTGREFVTGSYDRTVRIFPSHGGSGGVAVSASAPGAGGSGGVSALDTSGQRSRDVYHTKRMGRVMAARFAADGSYVVSGSDDFNVRIWKARASEPVGVVLPAERQAIAYRRALVSKHKHIQSVRQIANSRKVPKVIKSESAKKKVQLDSEKRKRDRVKAHSKPGTVVEKGERVRKLLRSDE